MTSILLTMVLAQASVVQVQPTPVAPAPLLVTSFGDGHRSYPLYESATLVAEPSPTDAVARAVLVLEPSAVTLVDRPTMRIWKVKDARVLRAAFPSMRPAFHDVPGAGRIRVPMGLVCKGAKQAASWQDVLAKSGVDSCLPDFWYPPVLR